MVDLVRHFSPPGRALAPTHGGLPGWRLRRIEERVRAEGKPPTLDELAGICAMSPRHLTRAFRQQTGQSIGVFVEEVRAARARSLLAAGETSLKEIADRLGFAQASALSTAFRRATGETPSAYRARLQAERAGAFVSLSRNDVPGA
jgi:AraC family transcriptional regulator